jgi:hypothetical protein
MQLLSIFIDSLMIIHIETIGKIFCLSPLLGLLASQFQRVTIVESSKLVVNVEWIVSPRETAIRLFRVLLL